MLYPREAILKLVAIYELVLLNLKIEIPFGTYMRAVGRI